MGPAFSVLSRRGLAGRAGEDVQKVERLKGLVRPTPREYTFFSAILPSQVRG